MKKIFFYLLIQSPNGHKSQGYSRPKPEVQDCIWVSHLGANGPMQLGRLPLARSCTGSAAAGIGTGIHMRCSDHIPYSDVPFSEAD